MNISREQIRLYAVTDRSWLGNETLYEQVEKALKGGVTLVQLREKNLDEAAFEKEGRELLKLCHQYHVPLLINDNVELAAKIGGNVKVITEEPYYRYIPKNSLKLSTKVSMAVSDQFKMVKMICLKT